MEFIELRHSVYPTTQGSHVTDFLPSRQSWLLFPRACRNIGFIALNGWLCIGVNWTHAIEPVIERSESQSGYRFKSVKPPMAGDLGATGKWERVEGTIDRNSGGLGVLHDDRLPGDEDQPQANFFFRAASDGGRLRVDLGSVQALAEVSSYSWHPSVRGPQVYEVYTCDESATNLHPARPLDPTTCGWQLLANVDTRRVLAGDGLGPIGVTISISNEDHVNARYLLIDIKSPDPADPFAQTFFSEFDVVARADSTAKPIEQPVGKILSFATEDNRFQFRFDLSQAPDLEAWTVNELIPVVQTWYPQIVAALPSDGYTAPQQVQLQFREQMQGVPAYAIGSSIHLNAPWFRKELNREAKGAVVHELVHVVQQYQRRNRSVANSRSTPGWVVEGIADYVRWFLYEPQSKGAEISKTRGKDARHDASYRVTANFLDWVIRNHDQDLLEHLNAAAREAKYVDQIWVQRTTHSLPELEKQWKQSLFNG